jgi:hypothetical protein
MTRDWLSDLGRLLRLLPTLVMRDPLFRYAAIAAVLALLFLIGQFAQDLAGHPSLPVTSPGAAAVDPQRPAASTTGQRQSPAAPIPVEIPAIAPGRPLNGIIVDPAPADPFGKLPKGAKSP